MPESGPMEQTAHGLQGTSSCKDTSSYPHVYTAHLYPRLALEEVASMGLYPFNPYSLLNKGVRLECCIFFSFIYQVA